MWNRGTSSPPIHVRRKRDGAKVQAKAKLRTYRRIKSKLRMELYLK